MGCRADLPSGDYFIMPDDIEPIHLPSAEPIAAAALTSLINPASSVEIPPGSDWRITLGYAEILHDETYPAFHGKRHSGIDIYRWNAHPGAGPCNARAGAVIDSVYLPKGFGNTVAIEHNDGTCLRYTHLDKKLVKKGGARHTRPADRDGRQRREEYLPGASTPGHAALQRLRPRPNLLRHAGRGCRALYRSVEPDSACCLRSGAGALKTALAGMQSAFIVGNPFLQPVPFRIIRRREHLGTPRFDAFARFPACG